jgi:hypothetical protein
MFLAPGSLETKRQILHSNFFSERQKKQKKQQDFFFFPEDGTRQDRDQGIREARSQSCNHQDKRRREAEAQLCNHQDQDSRVPEAND